LGRLLKFEISYPVVINLTIYKPSITCRWVINNWPDNRVKTQSPTSTGTPTRSSGWFLAFMPVVLNKSKEPVLVLTPILKKIGKI
jgi:hypothetical protein